MYLEAIEAEASIVMDRCASFSTLSHRYNVGQNLLGGIGYYSAHRRWTTAYRGGGLFKSVASYGIGLRRLVDQV